ncbi:MAG: hypothetical protein ACYTKD_27175 [Planctomycetota bacterium]
MIDAGMTVVFLDLPDGTILTLGGAGGFDLDARTPTGKCVKMLREAFISWPLEGEDFDIAAERKEIGENLHRFKPNGDAPYACVYDIAPICKSDRETAELAGRIRESVAGGKWVAELGNQLEVRDRRLFAVAPPAMQRLLRDYLGRQGMAGAGLHPIPPERLLPPRGFSEREIDTVRTDRTDPTPAQLLLIRPAPLEPSGVQSLSGARLWIAIQNKYCRPDDPTAAAIRSRRSPLLVCAVLAGLMERAAQDGDGPRLAELSAIAERWKRAAPWSAYFVSCFRLLVRFDDTGRP